MGRKKERKIGNLDYRLTCFIAKLDVFVQALTESLPEKERLRVNGYEAYIDDDRIGANVTITPAGWKGDGDGLAVNITDFNTCKIQWAGIYSDRLLPLFGTRAIILHPTDGGGLEIEGARAHPRLSKAIAAANKAFRSVRIR